MGALLEGGSSSQDADMSQLVSSLLADLCVWNVRAKLDDGHIFVWATITACVLMQSVCRLAVGSHAAVKLVSILFDFVAIIGAIKELLAPEEGAIEDPIAGFSGHAQLHISIAAGYFAWAAMVTLLYTRSPVAFLHHALCCAIFCVGLQPFLHHVGCIFLLYQLPTLAVNMQSLARALRHDSDELPRCDNVEHRLHVALFVVVRVFVGLPMSLRFLRDMALALALEQPMRTKPMIVFAMFVNILINGLGLHWLLANARQPCARRTRLSSPCVSDEPSPSWVAGQQLLEFKFDVPISGHSHLSTRKLRLSLSYGFVRAAFCLFVACCLALAAQCLCGLPDAPPLSDFGKALHGDYRRNLTQISVLQARRKVDALVASGRSLRFQGDVDVVISGGGFRGQYAGGVIGVLKLLEEKGLLHIRRWSGTSVGALTAASFATGAPFETFIRTPYAWAAVWQPKRFWEGQKIIREKLNVVIPFDDAHKRANGTVFVHVTQFNPLPHSRVISEFDSRQMFFDALTASATLPGFSGDPFFSRFEGKITVDGGLTRNVPVFRDGLRPQLVINLAFIQLPALYTFAPLDPNPEDLVLKGIDDAITTLDGGNVRALEVILSSDLESGGRSTAAWMLHHHQLLYDIMVWGLYGFGPLLLFGMLALVAMIVALVECCGTRRVHLHRKNL